MAITTIPADWLHWLQENLVRKVPEARLLEVMTKAGFDADAVLGRIATLTGKPVLQPLDGLPPATELSGDWQGWLMENIDKGVFERTLVDAATRDIRAAWAQRTAALLAHSEAQGYTYEPPAFPLGTAVQTGGLCVPVLMAMEQPRIALFGNVLSKEECEAVIALGQPQMAPSTTRDNATAELVVTGQRRSRGTFLKRGETALVAQLEQRIADLARWPVNKGEGLQILHYQDGDEYVPHFDFFPPEQPGSQISLRRGGQRVATLIVYLNTVEEGGETYFPKLNLKIKAVQGNALYFSYTNSKNEVDRMTLHGGSPVIQGEKWIMTKWMRQDVF